MALGGGSYSQDPVCSQYEYDSYNSGDVQLEDFITKIIFGLFVNQLKMRKFLTMLQSNVQLV